MADLIDPTLRFWCQKFNISPCNCSDWCVGCLTMGLEGGW